VNLSPAYRGRIFFMEGTIMTGAVITQSAPFGKELEAGKTYYWRPCGRSANQPYCDRSHKSL
jgi:CDGSH-type Zn-finger protein